MFDFILDPLFTLGHNIVANCQDFAEHAPPIDWSGTGGVPWLLGTLTATMAGMVAVAMLQARAERAVARAALYREAEAEGHLRNARRDWRGYAE